MPTAKPPESAQVNVTPSPVRRSARLTRSTQPFDPSDVEVPTPAPKVSSPTHDLISQESVIDVDVPTAADVSPTVSSVVSESNVGHVSDAWSKKQLHQKWQTACGKVLMLKSQLTKAVNDQKELKKQLLAAERKLRVEVHHMQRSEKFRHDLAILGMEKSSLEDELSSLKSEQARAKTAHKNELKHVESDREYKLESQKLSSQRVLNEEKLKLKEKEVEVHELQEKVLRLEECLQTQHSKIKDYDAIAAQAVKAKLGLKSLKEKASVR